jgi:hypothetical protein
LPFCSKTIGGEAGDTATLISFESVLEHAAIPKAISTAIKSKKKRFIYVSLSIKLCPKGLLNKYMGFAGNALLKSIFKC